MEIFPEIPKIEYKGPNSTDPLSFKYYNPERSVAGKSMAKQLRFSIAFWHSFNGGGADQFGGPTALRPWDGSSDEMKTAELKMRGCFELAAKLQVPYYCFHDRDIAPTGATLRESNAKLDKIVALANSLQTDYPVKLLWCSADLFSHPRYMFGAATSPHAESFAHAAAQVKKAMQVCASLGGENYLFWGGREGYDTLLNTNLKIELDNLARFLHMAVDYAVEIGFSGQLLIEPKPKEPTKHQYDFDVATTLGFLRHYELADAFRLNIEANHATLAGHTMHHELSLARIYGALGSVDANQGDLLLGWDTDQFPTNIYTSALTMYEILKNGGLHRGGLNFDAKVRRGSFTTSDLVEAHIVGMDTYARGLLVAQRLIEEGELDRFVDDRYASYTSGIGRQIVLGKTDFRSLEKYIIDREVLPYRSGHQERLEGIVFRAIQAA